MDFRHVYELASASWSAFRVEPVGKTDMDERGLFQGAWAPAEPIVWRHYMGGAAPKDLVPTGYVGPILVSDRVVNVLREHQFTGWNTYPVTLLGKKKEVIPRYHGLTVTGRCGQPDDRLSPVEWREPLVPNGPRIQVRVGLYFDPATWTGEDIFSPPGSGWCFVTERVKAAVEKTELTNLRFTRLTAYESTL